MPMGKIQDIKRGHLVFFQNDAGTQHVDFFPKVIKPNRVGQNGCFPGLYEQAGMPDQGGLEHFLIP
jgi:hypothetical protein